MEITLEKINIRVDPYQLFLDSIKDKETARRYRNLLHTFLKLIPNQIYQDILGEIPQDRERETLAKFFVEIAKKDPDIASNIIAAFIKEDKKRMLKVSNDITDKVIITMFTSEEFRLETWTVLHGMT